MAAKEALDGLKVADFSWWIAGPLVVKYLAEHGAQVIHIESSIKVDGLRTSGPFKDKKPGINRSLFFANQAHNKYGVTLNLRHPKGAEIAKKIVAWSDVVVENFVPGTMEAWGLGYEELKKVKPDIIMFRTCMQGQTGPHSNHPGTGAQLPALAGFMHITGWANKAPSNVFGAYTDYLGSRLGAASLIAALDNKRRTGKGMEIDVSQFEASLVFIAPLLLDYGINGHVFKRCDNKSTFACPHNVYPCKGDNRWCAIAVTTDEQWEAFCTVIGNPTWTKDKNFATLFDRKKIEDRLDKHVAEWTINHTAEEVMRIMQAAGVSAGVVKNGRDLCDDPQLIYRHFRNELEHPEIGKYKCMGPGFRLSRTPARFKTPAHCLGEHNHFVYTEILGMSDEEFTKLLNDGVFK